MKFFGTRLGTFAAVVLVVVVMCGAIAVAVPGRTRLSPTARLAVCSADFKTWIDYAGKYHRVHLEPAWPPEFGPSTGVQKWIQLRISLHAPVTKAQRRANHAVPSVREECSSLVSRGVDVTHFPSPYVVSSPKSRNTSVSGSHGSMPHSRQSIRGAASPPPR